MNLKLPTILRVLHFCPSFKNRRLGRQVMLNYPFQHLINMNDWYFVFSYLEFKTNITLTRSVSTYDTDNESISQFFVMKNKHLL